MMTRGSFSDLLAAFVLSGAAVAVPLPALPKVSPKPADASPAPSGSPDLDALMCQKNLALPYDRPLGLRMETLDGPDFNLLKMRGKIVLINIFATWCGPCRRETPAIIEMAHAYAVHGVTVIGMNYNEPDNTVREFRKKYSIDYPIAMDRDGGYTDSIEAVGHVNADLAVPVSLFIRRSGYLACYSYGARTVDALSWQIERMLDDEPLPSATATSSPEPK